MKDIWHYSRTELAKQILGLFETGLSSSLVFFAPRRMGKTEFLQKDILPLAEKLGWKVMYLSFLGAQDARAFFLKGLSEFASRISVTHKATQLFKKIGKIGAGVGLVKAEIGFAGAESHDELNHNIESLLSELGKKHRILFLMDEIQILAADKNNNGLISSFRTALDINKDQIKIIFTGSSQTELRKMFSEKSAPFFHFGQNLPFPVLDQKFTDHLADVFKKVTQRTLNKDELFKIFDEVQRVPLLIRSLVERLALHPDLKMREVQKSLLDEVFTDQDFSNIWAKYNLLDQLILKELALENSQLFMSSKRQELADILGLEELSSSALQSAISRLIRNGVIGKSEERSGYFIDDPHFKNWLKEEKF